MVATVRDRCLTITLTEKPYAQGDPPIVARSGTRAMRAARACLALDIGPVAAYGTIFVGDAAWGWDQDYATAEVAWRLDLLRKAKEETANTNTEPEPEGDKQ